MAVRSCAWKTPVKRDFSLGVSKLKENIRNKMFRSDSPLSWVLVVACMGVYVSLYMAMEGMRDTQRRGGWREINTMLLTASSQQEEQHHEKLTYFPTLTLT